MGIPGAAYILTLATGPSWANNGSDSGELITAAATLGVAHPTGYPTYLLVLRAFQALPLGDLAARSHLLSACAAVLAALCVYGIVGQVREKPPWHHSTAAAIAALWFGLSSLVWSQAVVAEVYTLNALFVGLIVLWMAQLRPPVPGWHERGRGLLVGLALGNHITVALPALVWLGSTAWRAPADLRGRLLRQQISGIALGLLVYLSIPLRAAAQPPINWGGASSWTGFWWLISGDLYRDLAFGLPPEFLTNRLQAWASLLLLQAGWLGLAVGFFGLLYAVPVRLRWISAGLAAAYSVFAIAYNTADSYAYLLPVYLLFGVWLGCGLSQILDWARQRHSALAPAVVVCSLLLVGWSALQTAPLVDASEDRRAIVFASHVLNKAPPRAVVLTSSDRDTFALWYYHFAQDERPDLVVVARPLLAFEWYWHNLRATYPALALHPQPPAERLQAIEAASGIQQRPVCTTQPDQQPFVECPSTP